MNPHSSQPDDSSSPWWQAFCYLYDEMPDEEREAFESRAEHDSALQQALTEMMVLSELLRRGGAAEIQVVGSIAERRSVGAPRRRPALGWLAAAAASLVLVVAGSLWVMDRQARTAQNEVALAWADQLDEQGHLLIADVEWNWRELGGETNEGGESGALALAEVGLDELSESWVFAAALESEGWDWSGDGGSGSR